MTEEASFIGVADDENLARFILFSNWVRNSDKTVKQDAFIPYPYPNLSVTRHATLNVEELCKIGQEVADSRPANLYGYANIKAFTVRQHTLDLEIAPTTSNPDHANIIRWPTDKPAQKIIALRLASESTYCEKP